MPRCTCQFRLLANSSLCRVGQHLLLHLGTTVSIDCPLASPQGLNIFISHVGDPKGWRDDILVYGNSKEEHQEYLIKVLGWLQRSGITLNKECHSSFIFRTSHWPYGFIQTLRGHSESSSSPCTSIPWNDKSNEQIYSQHCRHDQATEGALKQMKPVDFGRASFEEVKELVLC